MSHHTGSVPDTPRAKDWRDTAACRTEDPDLFFPAGTTGPFAAQIAEAKRVCARCPSWEHCLRWALDTGQETGIWGGTSEAERRALQRRRGAPLSVDDYTGTPNALTRGRTLQEAWEENTRADGDHVRWVGPATVHRAEGRALTPNRLAFYLDRDHWPEGDVKRLCQVEGCVRPAHLADRRERAEVVELADAA